MDKLGIYALYDKENSLPVPPLVNSIDERAVAKYYIDSLDHIFQECPKEYKKDFNDRVNHQCICRIGYYDFDKKELVNDFNILVDLFDLKFEDKEKVEDGRSEEGTSSEV